MAETPTTEPSTITAGDTVTWTKSLASYPATAGWTLAYALRNAVTAIDIQATASGADHLVSLPAATTANYAAGAYRWYAFVSNQGETERHTVATGSLTVLPDLLAATSYDARSHARKVLDAIEAVLEKRASRDQEEITINGNAIKKSPIADLLRLRSTYQALVASEEAAERLSSGAGVGRGRLLVRL